MGVYGSVSHIEQMIIKQGDGFVQDLEAGHVESRKLVGERGRRERGELELTDRLTHQPSSRVFLLAPWARVRACRKALVSSALLEHESLQPCAVRSEKQPLGAQPGDIAEQNPRGRPDEFAVQHERLLLQAEGAGAEHPTEQEGQQDGNPAARHRLHPGPADRPRHAPHHGQPPPPKAGAEPGLQDTLDPSQHRHQHLVVTGS